MSGKLKQKKFELGRMDIVDLYGWHQTQKLITGPYFQRFSVWKEKDRIDFIDTILKGYPIPSIFLCEGDMDLITLQNTYYVLDGRQRLESIFKFMSNQFKYNNKFFKDFSDEEKKLFLNYSIPIIQIYLPKDQKNNEDEIKEIIAEIFKRLNKNSYNLNKIEMQTSQYNDFDFIKICKIICGFLSLTKEQTEEEILEEESEGDEVFTIDNGTIFSPQIKEICKKNNIKYINELFTQDLGKKKTLFTLFQKTRQINLQYLINIIGSIQNGFLNRNLIISKTEDFSSEEFLTNHLNHLIINLNKSSKLLLEILKNKTLNDWWISKTNLFSLLILIYNETLYDVPNISKELVLKLNNFFESNSSSFEKYKDCCINSVNDRNVRITRHNILLDLIKN